MKISLHPKREGSIFQHKINVTKLFFCQITSFLIKILLHIL